mgnify:CR=1 FL=1
MVIRYHGQGQPIPEELLLKAQKGDTQSREVVIKAFKPHVVRVASSCCGRYLRVGEDEEISVALLALNEAIDSYKPGQGNSFPGFVSVVVKRRLIDYYRRNKTRHLEIPFSNFEDDAEETSTLQLLEQKEAEKVYSQQEEARERQEEIVYYTRLLAEYNITLRELVKCSPKHESARRRAILAAELLANDPELVARFRKYKELPLKEIENKLPFSRKTLERHRKYIVALLLVRTEDLPHIRAYLKGDNGA